MKRCLSVLAAVWIIIGYVAEATAAQKPAVDVMRDAQAKAAAEAKNVFLVFGAQTCSWCKVFRKFREADEIKPIFEKYFVEAHLQLGDDATANPGADVYETKYKVLGSGVPFFAFLKPDGTTIVESRKNRTGDNIGYPADAEDILWFMTMLSEAAPRMTDSEKHTIETKLKAFKRK